MPAGKHIDPGTSDGSTCNKVGSIFKANIESIVDAASIIASCLFAHDFFFAIAILCNCENGREKCECENVSDRMYKYEYESDSGNVTKGKREIFGEYIRFGIETISTQPESSMILLKNFCH